MKPLFNYPGYFITKDSKVWSEKTKRFLKEGVDSYGYKHVCPYKNGKALTKRIHRLMLETFVGPCPPGMECCHNNDIRTDNKLENLRWDTRNNNLKDGHRNGVRCQVGERNTSSKLKESDVRFIIYLKRTKLFSRKEIASIFNISVGHIDRIMERKVWKHIWK